MDLTDYRKAVHERLVRTGLFHCVRQEDFGAQDSGAADFCRQKAQEADMFVGLIGLRRGWEPDGDNEKRSITEMEHDWARDAGRARYLWVAPDDFAVPGNTRESDELHARQMAFRKRVMGGGERIVSQKGFGSPELLASEIVEQLMVQVVTTDLLSLIRLDALPSKEDHVPAIATSAEHFVEDKDVDLLALARDPKGVDLSDLKAKLKANAEDNEAKAGRHLKQGAEYWCHLADLVAESDKNEALHLYNRALQNDPEHPVCWQALGELYFELEDYRSAEKAFKTLCDLASHINDAVLVSYAFLRLSRVSQLRGHISKADLAAMEALAAAEASGWQRGVASACRNIALIAEQQGDLERAEHMQRRASKIFTEIEDMQGLAGAHLDLGLIYLARGDLDRAVVTLTEALALNAELGRTRAC